MQTILQRVWTDAGGLLMVFHSLCHFNVFVFAVQGWSGEYWQWTMKVRDGWWTNDTGINWAKWNPSIHGICDGLCLYFVQMFKSIFVKNICSKWASFVLTMIYSSTIPTDTCMKCHQSLHYWCHLLPITHTDCYWPMFIITTDTMISLSSSIIVQCSLHWPKYDMIRQYAQLYYPPPATGPW